MEESMRLLAIAGLTYLALLIDLSVPLWELSPLVPSAIDLMFLATCLMVRGSSRVGVAAGLGLLSDVVSGYPLGMSVILFSTFAVVWEGWFNPAERSIPMLKTLFATVVTVVLIGVVRFLVGTQFGHANPDTFVKLLVGQLGVTFIIVSVAIVLLAPSSTQRQLNS